MVYKLCITRLWLFYLCSTVFKTVVGLHGDQDYANSSHSLHTPPNSIYCMHRVTATLTEPIAIALVLRIDFNFQDVLHYEIFNTCISLLCNIF